ncbi:DUF805 domain-containing protein [Solirhodobacter olei]|uniref:DUF805 domain-containing protein n=1 Tax=Solirhodobacter olei TaxID=2493082 RepID=UPI0013E2B90D|nr:DUF805 domain-containing protein [Solirhodobacter olei]
MAEDLPVQEIELYGRIGMSFERAIATCLHQYANFSGRASRSEFWWFTLAVTLAYVVAAPALGFLGLALFDDPLSGRAARLLLGFALLVPWLSAGYRRLHDIGWPGWPILLPSVMTLAWPATFIAMWFFGGDAKPASEVQFAIAQVLAVLLWVLTWMTLPTWAVLAYFLARPSKGAASASDPPSSLDEGGADGAG